jgi:hypothetical protein
MGNIGDHCNHIVVETVSIVGVRSMPESRSHSKSGKGLLECILVSSVNSKIGIIADSGSGVIVGNVRSIVAWLINHHLVLSKFPSSLVLDELFVVTNWASGSISRKASSPVVSLVHVIVSSSIRSEVITHAFPSGILRDTSCGVVEFTEASLQLGKIDGIILSRANEKSLHIVQILFGITSSVSVQVVVSGNAITVVQLSLSNCCHDSSNKENLHLNFIFNIDTLGFWDSKC